MPKKLHRDKRGRRAVRRETPSGGSHVRSVKELLTRVAPSLKSVTVAGERQRYWESWLAERLAPTLRANMSGVTERDGQLVVFATSGAWSARLRFAMLELEAAVRAAQPGINSVKVRVLPRP